jgi:hypothetical protein
MLSDVSRRRTQLIFGWCNMHALQIFGPGWESNAGVQPIAAKFMEKNYKGHWVSRGITATAFGKLSEGTAVLLMPTFKLQNTVR